MPIADRTVPATLSRDERWPPLPLDAWADTRETLHMWTQIVGKLNVELAPFQNQLWHTALHLTTRGLTTGRSPSAAASSRSISTSSTTISPSSPVKERASSSPSIPAASRTSTTS